MLKPAIRSAFALLALASFQYCLASIAMAAPVKTPHVEAELISRDLTFVPGQPVQLALRMKIIDHWHTYWRNPGDSGLPTKLAWSLPAGFVASPIEWPYPKKLPLGPLMNFGYEGEVLHLVKLQTPANASASGQTVLKAKAEWLVCSDVCIPESADLSISLTASAKSPAPDNRWTAQFVAARAAVPLEDARWKVSTSLADATLAIKLTPASNATLVLTDVSFFPVNEELIANAGKQVWSKIDTGYQLLVPAADAVNPAIKNVEGVLVATPDWGGTSAAKAISISAPLTVGAATAKPKKPSVPTPSADNQLGLAAALLFAFAGGLLLNLMPCVFPVLGIKIMGFVQHAQSDASLLRKQGFAFLAGVVVSFWALAALLAALRAAGESVGWGFQLQSPLFVTFLAMLFLLMALNLSGIFEMGLRVQSVAGNLDAQGMSAGNGKHSATRDAFLSGVLATVVATPCTAPMMGAALGFTLSQPAYLSFLVFTAIALGMALPVVALSLAPKWLRLLPKPGAWMNTLKQLLAFPLFATVVWLTWVLGSQIGNDGVAKLLFGLVLVALAAWLYGHWQMSKPLRAVVMALVVGISGMTLAWPDPVQAAGEKSAENGWIPFSAEKIVALRAAGKPVFVDFTATWCITCQVNKRVALNQPGVVKRFKELDVVLMKADWTVKDAKITEALAEFGRNGVPLYVYYAAGEEPKLLPEVLTTDIVLGAIEPTAKLVTR